MEMEIVKNLLWSVAGLFVVFAMAVLIVVMILGELEDEEIIDTTDYSDLEDEYYR
jgi:hypothetical protein